MSPASGGGVDDGQAKLGAAAAAEGMPADPVAAALVEAAWWGERNGVSSGDGSSSEKHEDESSDGSETPSGSTSRRRRRRVEVEALAIGAVPHAGTGRGGAGGGLAGRDRLGLFGSARASGCGGGGSRERTVRRRRDAAGFETGRGTAVAVLPQARRGRAVGAQRGVDADPDASPRGGRIVGWIRTRARSAASRGFSLNAANAVGAAAFSRAWGARTAHPDARATPATGATGRGAGPRGGGGDGGGDPSTPSHLSHGTLRLLSVPVRREQL